MLLRLGGAPGVCLPGGVLLAGSVKVVAVGTVGIIRVSLATMVAAVSRCCMYVFDSGRLSLDLLYFILSCVCCGCTLGA